MGDVIAFPDRRARAADGPAAGATDARAEALAQLRRSAASLEALTPVLIESGENLSAAIVRLGTQRRQMQQRTVYSRAIEQSAAQLCAIIESGDLAAAERLLPEAEALVRATAMWTVDTDDAAPASAVAE